MNNLDYHYKTDVELLVDVDDSNFDNQSANEKFVQLEVEKFDSHDEQLFKTLSIKFDTEADYVPLSWVSWCYKSKQLVSLTMPIMGSYMLNAMVNITLLAFVGQLSEVHSAAAGLANTFISVTGYAFILGLLSALDTLCPQAFGSENYSRVSVILYRGVLLTWILSIPVFILWGFTRDILLLFGQSEAVSLMAGYFVKVQIPALPFYTLAEALRKYMQAQAVVVPGLIVLLVVDLMSILIGYILILHTSVGYHGFPFVLLSNNILQALGLIGYIYFSKLYILTYSPFKLSQIFRFDGFLEFMSLGLPGVAMLSTEWIGFEIHTIMAGLLSLDILTAHVILLNINYTVYIIGITTGVAVNSMVGNEFGSGRYQEAKHTSKVGFINTQVFIIIVSVTLFIFRNHFVGLFTKNQSVIAIATDCIFILPLFLCSDSAQGVLGGVIKGIGLQKKAGIINIVSYYVIGIPLGIVMAFKWGFNMQLRGLWAGIAIASWTATLLDSIVLIKENWLELSRRAVIRSIDKEKIIPNVSNQINNVEKYELI